jgi:hypothetical protein
MTCRYQRQQQRAKSHHLHMRGSNRRGEPKAVLQVCSATAHRDTNRPYPASSLATAEFGQAVTSMPRTRAVLCTKLRSRHKGIDARPHRFTAALAQRGIPSYRRPSENFCQCHALLLDPLHTRLAPIDVARKGALDGCQCTQFFSQHACAEAQAHASSPARYRQRPPPPQGDKGDDQPRGPRGARLKCRKDKNDKET